SCQFLTGDADRKPKVILNPGAAARLSSGIARLDHEHIEPFRCTHHRRGEACGPSSNDDHVAEHLLIDQIIEAETIRDLLITRTAKYPLSATHHDRKVG